MLFSVGGLAIAVLLLVAGFVLTSNASFANKYVHDQLAEQNIVFKPASTLTDEEKKSACLNTYAGQQLTTGKQAECYANDFIGLHVKSIAGGKTYADLGTPQADLRAKVTAAQQANDPNLADLQKQLDSVTAQRETLFKGETSPGSSTRSEHHQQRPLLRWSDSTVRGPRHGRGAPKLFIRTCSAGTPLAARRPSSMCRPFLQVW
jgi:hypothetical protein